MKQSLRHYFRPAVTALVLSAASATAADPPQLKLPETLQPRVVKHTVKATNTVDPNLKIVNIEAAWKRSKGEGVTVFVADTGIDLTHSEFKGVPIERVNFTTDPDADDGNGHGTFCASEIAGQNSVDGAAPKIKKLVALKVLANNGSGSLDWLRKAIDYAAKYDTNGGPKVFSASLGATPGSGSDSADVMPDLQASIRNGIAAGIVFVFAAGNDDSKLPPNSVGWPARFNGLPGLESLIVVAACDLNRKVTDFSSVGPATWVTVVGHDVLGALPKEQHARWDGTSMATPIVAAIAACWLSAYGHAVPPKDRQAAVAEAFRVTSSFPDQRHPARGYGLPDCGKMFAAAPPGAAPEKPLTVTITLDDLSEGKRAELRAGGVDTLRLEVGHAVKPGGARVDAPPPPPPPIPVQAVPVPGQWSPPAQPWYPATPQPVPQWMPGPCPGGMCPVPQPSAGGWVPGQVIRRVFR